MLLKFGEVTMFQKTLKKLSSLGFPISMAIEPTTSCNLRCPECPSGLRQFTRPIGMLEPAFFKRLLTKFVMN